MFLSCFKIIFIFFQNQNKNIKKCYLKILHLILQNVDNLSLRKLCKLKMQQKSHCSKVLLNNNFFYLMQQTRNFEEKKHLFIELQKQLLDILHDERAVVCFITYRQISPKLHYVQAEQASNTLNLNREALYYIIFSRPGRSQGLLYKQPCN